MYCSDEELRDATPGFLDYTIRGLAQALAEAEDKQFSKAQEAHLNLQVAQCLQEHP